MDDKQVLNNRTILAIIVAAIILSLLGIVVLQINPISKIGKILVTPTPTPIRTLEKKVTIKMTDKGFEPQNLIVKRGATFTFENKSKVDFEIVFPGKIKIFEGKFSPGTVAYAEVKTPPGKYEYVNKLNPSQKASIIVEE